MKTLLNAPATLLLAFALGAGTTNAQQVAPPDSIQSQAELDKVAAALDTAFFDAYNKCDVAKFKSYLADDLEFYHDQMAGALGKESLTELLKTSVCGKETRELVPGSLQAHRMTGYGALVTGVHRFHPKAPNDSWPVVEEKFIELWQYKDAGWKITRVIIYDHRVAN
jgi:ketosteroid isomerase-like protein